jgi:hypothetical protein
MYWKYPVTRMMVSNNAIVSPMLLKDLAEVMAGEFTNRVLSFVPNSNPVLTNLLRIVQYK